MSRIEWDDSLWFRLLVPWLSPADLARARVSRLLTQMLTEEAANRLLGLPGALAQQLPAGFPVRMLPLLLYQLSELMGSAALQFGFDTDRLWGGTRTVLFSAGVPPGELGDELERRFPLELERFWWAVLEAELSSESDGPLEEGEIGRPVPVERTPGFRGSEVGFSVGDIVAVLGMRATQSEGSTVCLDYHSRNALAVLLLRDGRLALAGTVTEVDSYEGGGTWRRVVVSGSLEQLVVYGMSSWERRHLGARLPGQHVSDSGFPLVPDSRLLERSGPPEQVITEEARAEWQLGPAHVVNTAWWSPFPHQNSSINTVRLQAAKTGPALPLGLAGLSPAELQTYELASVTVRVLLFDGLSDDNNGPHSFMVWTATHHSDSDADASQPVWLELKRMAQPPAPTPTWYETRQCVRAGAVDQPLHVCELSEWRENANPAEVLQSYEVALCGPVLS